MLRVSLLLLLARWSGAEPSTNQLRPHACLKEYTAEEVMAAVQREDVCTLLLLGAKWDGHYLFFMSGGAWQALAQYTCDDATIEVGVYHYSGAPAGQNGSIPMELGVGATLGSYSPRVFMGGRDFGELTRKIRSSSKLLQENFGKD